MTTGPKILAFAGSARKDSWNKHMVRIAAVGAQSTSDQSAGAEVTVIDLADYPMPILNLDDEAATGLPPNARKLKDLFLAHQGLLIASPEHNSSISSLLKNTIDWVSRPVPNEPPRQFLRRSQGPDEPVQRRRRYIAERREQERAQVRRVIRFRDPGEE